MAPALNRVEDSIFDLPANDRLDILEPADVDQHRVVLTRLTSYEPNGAGEDE